MEWKHVVILAVGAGLAGLGAFLRNEALLSIGSTVIGGILGLVAPRRETLPPALNGSATPAPLPALPVDSRRTGPL